MKIKIKKLHTKAVVPSYAKHGDAGMDLTAVSMEYIDNQRNKYNFGISIEIPFGYVGYVFPRSSCYKQGQMFTNAVGVIDSGYRGEISVIMTLESYSETRYKAGDRVAQLIIMPIPFVEFEETDELSETERGTGGYGSTGKN